jgi:hypothetical protein
MPAPFRPSDPQLLNDESSYVTRYAQGFKTDFDTGTAILWDILFSDSIAGNFDPGSDDFIYVTAWNRAAFGCEALVAYYRSTAPGIAVFDHKYTRFTAPAPQPISAFDGYVSTQTVGGIDVRSITVANMTYQGEGGWINEVYIPATNALGPYTLYRSQPYSATPADQKTRFGFDGAYGPTIEPSRGITNPYKGTSPIGWANARLANRDGRGNWSPWQPLSTEQSTIEPGLGGFTAKYSEPNFTAVLTT